MSTEKRVESPNIVGLEEARRVYDDGRRRRRRANRPRRPVRRSRAVAGSGTFRKLSLPPDA